MPLQFSTERFDGKVLGKKDYKVTVVQVQNKWNE